MKKTYMTPAVDMVAIQTHGFLAASPVEFDGAGGGGLTPQGGDAEGPGMSRRFDFDFDDEDDE